MAKRKKLILPERYIVIDDARKTVAVRGAGGRFLGRRGPDSSPSRKKPYLIPYYGAGDMTHARRVEKNVDLDKDGKTDFFGGTIQGRTVVKASKRAKGYTRRL